MDNQNLDNIPQLPIIDAMNEARHLLARAERYMQICKTETTEEYSLQWAAIHAVKGANGVVYNLATILREGANNV